MPGEMTSWADEIDETDTSLILPPPSEKWIGNQKITTEYSHNDDGKKVKIIRTFKIEKKLVSKAVARRKALAKFGMSRNDRPGPDPATTIIAEEILMNFVHNKEESEKDVETDALTTMASQNKGVVKCRICKEDHWTTMCPYKDTLGPLRDSLAGAEKDGEGGQNEGGKLGSRWQVRSPIEEGCRRKNWRKYARSKRKRRRYCCDSSIEPVGKHAGRRFTRAI